MTPKGRELYDQLLSLTRQSAAAVVDGAQSRDFDTILAHNFSGHYPDSWDELRIQGLVYFRYQLTLSGRQSSEDSKMNLNSDNLTHLLSLGLIEYEPITYEDFLPFSAAGIFKSNVSNNPADEKNTNTDNAGTGHRESFEDALGCKVLDEFVLYAALERESIENCKEALGMKEIIKS